MVRRAGSGWSRAARLASRLMDAKCGASRSGSSSYALAAITPASSANPSAAKARRSAMSSKTTQPSAQRSIG